MTHNDMEWQGSGAATSPVSQWQERVMTRLQPHVMIEVRHDSFSCESPLQHSATLSHISRQICLSRMWMSHVVHMYDIHMSVVICARVSCHTYVCRDMCESVMSYICTTWLIHMRVYMSATRLIYMRVHKCDTHIVIHIYDMTHLHVCVQVCDTTHLHECAYVQHTYRQLPRIYKNHTLSHTLIK